MWGNIGEVTVATTNADGSMRDLSDILADCRTAFSGLSESEKAAAAESLVGKNAMSGFLALMNAGEGDIAKLSGAIDNCNGAAQSMADTEISVAGTGYFFWRDSVTGGEKDCWMGAGFY